MSQTIKLKISYLACIAKSKKFEKARKKYDTFNPAIS